MKLPKILVELRTNLSLINAEKCAEIPWLFLRIALAVLSGFLQHIIYLATVEHLN